MTTLEKTTCPPGVLGWIPWYPDGLADEQRGAVETHAAECAVCREELAFLQGDAEPPADVPDPERVYAQVLARMESGGEGAAARERGTLAETPVRQVDPESPRPLAWRRVETRPLLALAASVLVALAVGASLGSWIGGTSEPVYETAMAMETTEAAPVSSGPALEVVFREDAGTSEINQALRSLDAQITGGPSRVGVYRLELPAGADVTAAAKLLMGDRGVATFAGKPLQP